MMVSTINLFVIFYSINPICYVTDSQCLLLVHVELLLSRLLLFFFGIEISR